MPTNSKKKLVRAPKMNRYWHQYFLSNTSSAKLSLDGFELTTRQIENKKSKYDSEKISLPSDLSSNLFKITKKHKIPLQNIYLGAWALLCHRYMGVDDVVCWTSAFYKENKNSLITSSHVIPLHSTINDKLTLLKFLQTHHKIHKHNTIQAKSLNIDTYEKEINYLFLINDEKKQAKTKSFNPNVTPLAFVLHEKVSKIEAIYNAHRLTKKSIHNLLEHYIIILKEIVDDINQITTQFSILTEDDKKKFLTQWNLYELKLSDEMQNSCVHDLFYSQVKRDPAHIAIWHSNGDLTYQQLDELSDQLVNVLQKNNITTGDAVAVLMDRTPAIFVAMMAIFKLGAIYVPIHPKYPNDRIEYILSDCNAKVIILNSEDRLTIQSNSKSVILDDTYSLLKQASKKKIANKVNPSDIAYVIYTSGTTGQPKGVMIRHSGLVNLTAYYLDTFAITPNDRSVQFASQGFDSFFCETIPYLTTGGSVYIIDDAIKLTPTLFLPWIVEQKITVCDLPTSYSQILLSLPWPKESSLRLMKIGGESLPNYPKQIFSFDIWNGYGPTEATVEATFKKVYDANVPPVDQPYKHLPPPIGRPISNCEAYIVDSHQQLAPVGVIGELLIGGKNLSAGYLNRFQLTREKFIRHFLSDNPDAKLYKTGDLARWLSDGNIEFMGRIDHQIKIRGFRIELSEIEMTISQYTDVQEVVVLVKEQINGQKTLLAYLVPNLDKLRIPFQDRCLLTTNDIDFIDLMTEDFSKEGVAISGLTDLLKNKQKLKINLKLPGMSDNQWYSGHVIWQKDHRVGIKFDVTAKQKESLIRSVEYYLTTHNLMDTLQSSSTKRSLRKALKQKLPDFMIPSVFTILPEFPLTFNGKIDVNALPPPHDFDRLLERKFVSPRNSTEKILVNIWKELLHQEQISITDNFFDLGGNSLLVSQLSVKIMQHFNMSVPAKIFFDLPFIPILAEYIDSKGKQYTYKSSIQEEISHDAILHDNIIPVNVKNPYFKNPRGVLLTGAGGFLGVYILKELLNSTDAKIYCLIRKGSFDTAAKRLLSTFNQYGLSDEVSLADRRIVVIPSDIGLDRFGMPIELYSNLLDKIDSIYHCGAQVNTMASYTGLRNSNVQGTIEILKFATQKVNKAVHYISTLSTAYKKDSKGRFAEEFPDSSAGDLVGGYALSKWVSERLITQIQHRGLPASIYRSGNILGRCDNGITNLNDALLLLIKGCIQLGIAPNWNERITLLPVDFVCKAIVGISLHDPESSKVYHLDHPTGIMWTDLVSWLVDYGYKLKLISHDEWLQKLTTINEENALFPFLPHYLEQKKEPRTPETAMHNSEQALSTVGLSFPEIDDALLHRYFNYFCQVGFLPEPGKKIRIT
jgi:amino acid adenylation domain-containing protein/thioester reductase-like protein